MPAKLNFLKTPASVWLVQVGPCPLPLEYQAASSQARLKSCRALPPCSRRPPVQGWILFGREAASMRLKARGLAQHGGPPGCMAEGEWPSRVWFFTWLTVHAACPLGPQHLPWFWGGSTVLLNAHKTSSLATSHKEDKVRYSSWPVPFRAVWLLRPNQWRVKVWVQGLR